MFLKQLTKQEKDIFLKLAIGVMQADGKIEESERAFIADYAYEMGIKDYDMNSDVDIVNLCKIIRDNSRESIKRIFLIELTACAYADGVFDKKEKTFIDSVASNLGLTQQDLLECLELIKSYVNITSTLVRFIEGD